MKRTALLLLLALGLCHRAPAQDKSYDVFVPIARYLGEGDVEKLSAWMASALDMSVLSTRTSCSRSQAMRVLTIFFESHSPRSFEITHTASRANMKYAIGTLSAGGERFVTTIFVSDEGRGKNFQIQQLKIERLE